MHRSHWICSVCSVDLNSSDALESHVSQHHRGLISDRQLSAFVGQSKRPVGCVKPSECPFCDESWARVDSNPTSRDEVPVVNLDQFRQHLGKHLQQVALFSLPRLGQGHDQSLGRHYDSGIPDQDAFSVGYRWIREDCGYGWSIVSRKRATFIALAFFSRQFRTYSNYTRVKVLLLYRENNFSYTSTQQEVNHLKDTFETLFSYHAEIKSLNTLVRERLQVRVKALVAGFVDEHDGPNTLLIVYYAGDGVPRPVPGPDFGSLNLFGSVAHGHCLAPSLIVTGNTYQMTRKIIQTFSYGTILSRY